MNTKNKTFEGNMLRLEQIVRTMEKGEVALEESLALFQEGTALAAQCSRLLDEAELQVNKILVDANGNPQEEPFAGANDD